jgi:hypothetical protein
MPMMATQQDLLVRNALHSIKYLERADNDIRPLIIVTPKADLLLLPQS